MLKPSQIRALFKISQAIDSVTEKLGRLCDWIVILLVAVGFYNVAARYIGRFIGMKLSSNALIELQWYLFSLLFFWGLPTFSNMELMSELIFFTLTGVNGDER